MRFHYSKLSNLLYTCNICLHSQVHIPRKNAYTMPIRMLTDPDYTVLTKKMMNNTTEKCAGTTTAILQHYASIFFLSRYSACLAFLVRLVLGRNILVLARLYLMLSKVQSISLFVLVGRQNLFLCLSLNFDKLFS